MDIKRGTLLRNPTSGCTYKVERVAATCAICSVEGSTRPVVIKFSQMIDRRDA